MKKYLLPLSIIITAILIYFIFIKDDTSRNKKQSAQGIERFPYPTDRLAESQADYVMADVQVGRIDLAIELVKLRRDCAGETDEAGCNERIKQLIQRLPGKDKQKLLEIFDQYLAFEAKMRQGSLPENYAQLTDQEKYKLVKKARRDFFGEDTARLIFGVEEARVALQEEQAKFASPEYANLPVEERLRLFTERKKEILGPYYQTTLEREPADIKFGTELMLHQTDMAKMPEAERLRTTQELRVKHFGEQMANRMAEDEARQNQAFAETNAKMDQFLAAEKAYLDKNPNLSDDQRRAGIEELRKKILSK
jgi:lipase chaperone LimK